MSKDKIEIYERSKDGETVVSLAKSFNVNKIIIHYLIENMDMMSQEMVKIDFILKNLNYRQ